MGNIKYIGNGYVVGQQPTSGGGGAAQNLLFWSEEMDNFGPWAAGGFTITPNTDNDLNGGLTLDTITDDGSFGSIQQTVTVTASTQYTFSFEAKRGTATVCRYSVRDASAGVDIIGRTDFFSLINSSTPTRISVTFTTPVGCTSVNLYIARPNETSTGTTKIGRAQLNTGATVKTYATTTSSIVP